MKSERASLMLRLPSSLHLQLKSDARSAELSLNRHCLALLGGKAGGGAGRRAPRALSLGSSSTRPGNVLKELSSAVLLALGKNLEGLVLFGSFARGQETARSDIDLLVVLSDGVKLDRDVYSRWRFGRFSGHEVAPLFVRIPAEGRRIGGLWFEVALEGIVLFDRNLQVSRFLAQVRKLIAADGVRRMVTHGHPYWIRTGPPARGGSSE
jgi:predicted nucleotidyltransferase